MRRLKVLSDVLKTNCFGSLPDVFPLERSLTDEYQVYSCTTNISIPGIHSLVVSVYRHTSCLGHTRSPCRNAGRVLYYHYYLVHRMILNSDLNRDVLVSEQHFNGVTHTHTNSHTHRDTHTHTHLCVCVYVCHDIYTYYTYEPNRRRTMNQKRSSVSRQMEGVLFRGVWVLVWTRWGETNFGDGRMRNWWKTSTQHTHTHRSVSGIG